MSKTKYYFGFDQNFDLKTVEMKKTENSSRGYFLLAKYANIGYYLLTPILTGVFLGLIGSRAFGNKNLVLAGVILGTIGTFYNLSKIYQDERKSR